MNGATAIIRSMRQEPERWEVDEYNATHESGLELWVANGWVFCQVQSPVSGALGLLAKWRVWRAFKKLRSDKVSLLFEKEPTP